MENSQKKSHSDHNSLLTTVFFSLVVGFLGGWMAVSLLESNDLVGTSSGQSIIIQDSEAISAIAAQVGPSVVSIAVETETTNVFFRQGITQESAGTGIVVSADGLILTNKHVIPDDYTSLRVILSDGTVYDDVVLVDKDPLNDIAFIQINGAESLSVATLGDSSKVDVGDGVVAIGNALGQYANTVTSGIISGIGRPVTTGDVFEEPENLTNLFQTDASINPGNSGGPLVNMKGEVIGVNTAVAGDAENIGFAIPINDAKVSIDSVSQEGRIIRPYLGVRYIDLTTDIAESLELSVERGAYLYSAGGSDVIIVDSPADKAGLQEEDIIIKVNEDTVDENASLAFLISKYGAGEVITLTVIRGEEELELTVILEEAPDNL